MALLPAINVLVFLVSALMYIDINPIDAAKRDVDGCLWLCRRFWLHHVLRHSFIFTALAVAAFHGLFNIGGEGQAYIGGSVWGLSVSPLASMPLGDCFPVAIVVGGLFGAAWAFIPAYLTATHCYHHHHV